MYVNYAEPHTFPLIEKNVLAIFASQAAIALEYARLGRAEMRKTTELAALANLSRSLAETMDLEEMFRVLERAVRSSLPAADAWALLIYNAQSDALVPRAAFGFDLELVHQISLRPR